MALDVTVASTDFDLTTTAAVKLELGISTGDTSKDARIAALIRNVSDWVCAYLGYECRAQLYRETLAAYGSRRLMLSRTPIRAVPALYYGTSTGDDAIQIASTEISIETEPGFIERLQGFEWSVPVVMELEMRPMPGDEFKPWLADYVAGWTYGGIDPASALYSTMNGTTSTGRTLPFNIEQAVVLKAAQRYAKRDGITSRGVGDLRVAYGTQSGSGLPADPAAQWLKPYVRTA